jgi:hypothetical protein
MSANLDPDSKINEKRDAYPIQYVSSKCAIDNGIVVHFTPSRLDPLSNRMEWICSPERAMSKTINSVDKMNITATSRRPKGLVKLLTSPVFFPAIRQNRRSLNETVLRISLHECCSYIMLRGKHPKKSFWKCQKLTRKRFSAKNRTLSVCANISVSRNQIKISIQDSHDDQEWW